MKVLEEALRFRVEVLRNGRWFLVARVAFESAARHLAAYQACFDRAVRVIRIGSRVRREHRTIICTVEGPKA